MTELHFEPEVKRFVREVLGCNCPEEVFGVMQIEAKPRDFVSLPVDYRIAIGNRLLVLVCRSRPWQEVFKALGWLVRTGRWVRERDGFNRVRFVVATEGIRGAKADLEPAFQDHAGPDNRIHLHLVRFQDLPDIEIIPPD